MPIFEVTVGGFYTGRVEVEADNEDEAIDIATDLVDTDEIDMESDGSYNYDVEEV